MRKLAIVVLALCTMGFAQTNDTKSATEAEHKHAPVAPNPAFEKMKALVGEWEGKSSEGGKEFATRSTFKLVSDGSALMNVLDPDGKYEMITMFHPDGKDFLATHYCASHNQPRMRAAAMTDPKSILFEFKDATNVGPNDGRMDHVKFIMLDNDHHVQEWSYLDKGKISTSRFEFTRKK